MQERILAGEENVRVAGIGCKKEILVRQTWLVALRSENCELQVKKFLLVSLLFEY